MGLAVQLQVLFYIILSKKNKYGKKIGGPADFGIKYNLN